MIPIRNVFCMLAYAFRALSGQGYRSLESEEFEGGADLFAAILTRGIEEQLKRGLRRGYREEEKESATLRGKLEVSSIVRTGSQLRRRIVCSYDEFTPDIYMNRILVTAATGLMRHSEVKAERRKGLGRVMRQLAGIPPLRADTINWRFHYDRNNASYRLLMFISRLVIEDLFLRDRGKGKGSRFFEDEQQLSHLYEKFIFEFCRKEFPDLKTSAMQIPWAVEEGDGDQLPAMHTDITLQSADGRVLIIDAKFYATAMSTYRDAVTLRSGHLYQLFAYVKNAEPHLKPSAPIAGLLLYARTDEAVLPDSENVILGNPMAAKTLDLNRSFEEIRGSLHELIESYFY